MYLPPLPPLSKLSPFPEPCTMLNTRRNKKKKSVSYFLKQRYIYDDVASFLLSLLCCGIRDKSSNTTNQLFDAITLFPAAFFDVFFCVFRAKSSKLHGQGAFEATF